MAKHSKKSSILGKVGLDSSGRSLILYCLAALVCITTAHWLFAAMAGKPIGAANWYNSYELQAQSWLEGRFDVDNRTWLELAVVGDKYYVSFPPFPSLLLLPFVAIFGAGVGADSYVAFASMLVGAVFTFALLHRVGLSGRTASLLTVFTYLATNMWQITVDAWVWFIAQNLAYTFTVMSLYFAHKGKKGTAMFLLICAAGCRPFQLLYLPLMLYLIWNNCSHSLKGLLFHKFYVYTPAILLGIIYCVLNFVRFGSIFEFGHNYLPEFTSSADGQFSLSYVMSNLSKVFRLPYYDNGHLAFPAADGMNIFLVIPLFVLYPAALITKLFTLPVQITRHKLVVHLTGAALILLHIFLLLMHKTMGGSHFGNRYIMDTVPMLLMMTGMAVNDREDNRFLEFVILLLGITGLLINFCGTLNYYS